MTLFQALVNEGSYEKVRPSHRLSLASRTIMFQSSTRFFFLVCVNVCLCV